MRFWCSTLETPWSWEFRAYPGIWAAMLLLAVPYVLAVRRRNANVGAAPDAKRKAALFFGGMFFLWLATDWPLGLLGASYLASAHMLQFMLYTMAAAPLMLLGTPEWMARRIVGRLRIYRLISKLSKPVVAGLTYNAILLFTHSPFAIDNFRTNQFGSFAMDVLWLLSGIILWLPIISPLPEGTKTPNPAKMAYLFLAAGIVPAIPAGFMTFADLPLYSIYELAPRVHGMSAATDQQLAGLVMKLGGIPVVWGTMLVLMVRWMGQDRKPPTPPERGPGLAEQSRV
ncbi:MAG: cytochrome c oxidase assembly protein [Acidimicrobiales bacterium]|nr:cytochrome c oxidase assembly protein [Acidimicrobiales bacterium]